jgi:hypothetical protein
MIPRFRRERAGISEVLSALILIIVVVTAVASLGFFLSTAQKQAEASRDYLTSVQNDDLQIVYSQFYPNDPSIQWELNSVAPASCTASIPRYTADSYIAREAGQGKVELIPPQGAFSGTTTAGTTDTFLQDSAASWTASQWVDDILTYTSGPAQGEPENITASTPTTITTSAFSSAPDASGDTFTISATPIQATLVALSGTATASNDTVLQDSAASWTASQWVGEVLTYTDGPAPGENETITANTATSITTTALSSAPDASGDTFTISGPYSAISEGKTASLTVSGSSLTLTFGLGGTCEFAAAAWGSITLTIRNTNTQPSSLAGIEVDTAGSQYAAKTWYQADQLGQAISTLGANKAPLVIPARASVNILLNSSSFGSSSIRFAKSSSLSVVLFSSMGNLFTTEYTAPTAISSASSFAENYQGATKDVIALNGSQSYGTGSSIQTYEWAIDVLPKTSSGSCPSSFGSPSFFNTIYLYGQSVQYSPGLFGPSGSSDCLSGPIRATLTVTDQNGFMATAPPLMLSPDPNIDPAGSISASKNTSTCAAPCKVTVTVNDAFGYPMAGAVVNAVAVYGDVVATPSSQTTNSTGQATFMVAFTNGGSMDFETGAIQPVQLAFPS